MSDSVTPWTVAYQAPLSMGFPRQENWSGLPLPSPGLNLVPTPLAVASRGVQSRLLREDVVLEEPRGEAKTQQESLASGATAERRQVRTFRAPAAVVEADMGNEGVRLWRVQGQLGVPAGGVGQHPGEG